MERLRAALFVDFDNVFLGLRSQDPAAADRFATDPGRWLRWLCAAYRPDPIEAERIMLMRSCYLNPRSFGSFRPYYTSAAFRVVDCPPLTYSGKTSADVYMVMDILDALGHATRFDEFIILSGDADFTPVLLRLRAHDRRTMILQTGPTAEALLASADCVIDTDRFVEDGLGMTYTAPVPPAEQRAIVPTNQLEKVAAELYRVASIEGPIPAAELARRVLVPLPEFRSSEVRWFGFGSLRSLTNHLVDLRDDLELVEHDETWEVAVREMAAAAPEEAAGRPVDSGEIAKLRDRVQEAVERLVSTATAPVPMALAAQKVVDEVGDVVLASRWLGAGTFKELLRGMDGLSIVLSPVRAGLLYDPARHAEPEEVAHDRSDAWPAGLWELASKISRVTGVPRLTPEEYAALFRAVADEVAAHGFQLNSTSKAVRDRCAEQGWTVSRPNASFVLRGLQYAGYRFGVVGHDSAEELARVFRRNVITLCDNAQLELDERDTAVLATWITSTPGEPSGQ
jgi:hypothetical protein